MRTMVKNAVIGAALDGGRFLANRLGFELCGKDFITSLRESNARAVSESQRQLAEAASENKRFADNAQLARQTFLECDQALTACDVPETASSENGPRMLSLIERVKLALASPIVERDFAWALDQIHAGRAVTHPILWTPGYNNGPESKGHVRQVGSLVKGGESTPVYQVQIGNMTWEKIYPDDSQWRDLLTKAQRSHGWEIVPPEPAKMVEMEDRRVPVPVRKRSP